MRRHHGDAVQGLQTERDIAAVASLGQSDDHPNCDVAIPRADTNGDGVPSRPSVVTSIAACAACSAELQREYPMTSRVKSSPHPVPRLSIAHVDKRVSVPYEIGAKIGQGKWATVRVARHVLTGELVAVKIIDKEDLDTEAVNNLIYETLCMKLVHHSNVVKLFEILDTPKSLYLIVEFADGGDLYSYLARQGTSARFDEQLARRYFTQMAQAIDYCHQLHVVHRDLKPNNIVYFTLSDVVKLTDFGLGRPYAPGCQLLTPCGSLSFSAPEMLLGNAYDPPAVDVWSLGVVLYVMVVGSNPFVEKNDSETVNRILDANYRRPPTFLSAECVHLISRMLQKSQSNRASVNEILGHPWLKLPARLPCFANGQPAPLTKDDIFSSQRHAGVPERPTDDMNHTALVAVNTLTVDDHEWIIEMMVSSDTITREEITRALEEKAYNHITASYYLIAERHLRHEREARYLALQVVPNQPDLYDIHDRLTASDRQLLTELDRSTNSADSYETDEIPALVSSSSTFILRPSTESASTENTRSFVATESPCHEPQVSRRLLQHHWMIIEEDDELENRWRRLRLAFEVSSASRSTVDGNLSRRSSRHYHDELGASVLRDIASLSKIEIQSEPGQRCHDIRRRRKLHSQSADDEVDADRDIGVRGQDARLHSLRQVKDRTKRNSICDLL